MTGLRTTFALALVLTVLDAVPVRAEMVFRYNIEKEIFHSEVAIEATPLEGSIVRVDEVLIGPAIVGQKLQLERFLDLSRKLDTPSSVINRAMGKETAPPPDATGRLFLFLSRDDRKQWVLEGESSGVKWLVNGKVYGYEQVWSTEGPCSLVPDREATTEPELRELIRLAIARKEKFIAARSIADPAKRVEALTPYIQSDEKNPWFFNAAAEALGKAGPVAGPLLRREAQRPNEFYRRRDILRALGASRDPEAAPFLLAIVEQAAPFMKAIEPYREKELSELQRAVLNDWNFAIYVLSDMADPRALPALREAMLWGVTRHSEMFVSASRGLGNMPNKENLPFLAQALASIPPGKNDWGVEGCLRALSKHRYSEVVPVLASQLKFPDHPKPVDDRREYNARVAHAALVDIVGTDLGTKKEAWIKWFEGQKE